MTLLSYWIMCWSSIAFTNVSQPVAGSPFNQLCWIVFVRVYSLAYQKCLVVVVFLQTCNNNWIFTVTFFNVKCISIFLHLFLYSSLVFQSQNSVFIFTLTMMCHALKPYTFESFLHGQCFFISERLSIYIRVSRRIMVDFVMTHGFPLCSSFIFYSNIPPSSNCWVFFFMQCFGIDLGYTRTRAFCMVLIVIISPRLLAPEKFCRFESQVPILVPFLHKSIEALLGVPKSHWVMCVIFVIN